MSKFWDAVKEALEEKSLSPVEVLENCDSLLDELVVRVMEIIPWPCDFGHSNPGIIHPVNGGESFVVMNYTHDLTVGNELNVTTFDPMDRTKEVLSLLKDGLEEE